MPEAVPLTSGLLAEGMVTAVGPDGTADVMLGDFDVVCDILDSGGACPLSLATGDTVLVWRTASAADGVIVGRVRKALQSEPVAPDTLVIEARSSLTLKVGDGSITIREDGSILIKGKDLVSHAKRRNRIRGGSVEIN